MAQGKNTNQRAREPRKSGGIWFGILIGLLTGLAGAAAVAVWVGRNNPFTERTAVSASQTANPATGNATANGTNSKGTGVIDPATHSLPPTDAHYDFYHILPGKDANMTAGNSMNVPPAANTPSPSPTPQQIWLQVGAFPDPQQADDLKAKLALMGMEASIQTVDRAEKGIWYRVRLGPYTADQVAGAQAQLAQNNIASTTIEGNTKSNMKSGTSQ